MGGPLGNNPPTPSYGGAGLAGCVAASSLVLLGPCDSSTRALPEDGRTETTSSWGLGPPSQWVHTQGVGTELLQAPAALGWGQRLLWLRGCLREASLFLVLLPSLLVDLPPPLPELSRTPTLGSPEMVQELGCRLSTEKQDSWPDMKAGMITVRFLQAAYPD